MAAQVLREYQQRALSEVLAAYRNGARRVLLVLPTGGGKTTVFGSLVHQLDRAQRASLILVHRRELATQACNRLREFGVDHGLIMAGAQRRPYVRVQVGTVQTVVRRSPFPRADLAVADEAHLSTAATWQTVLDAYPNARILGVTATPWRLGGKPLTDAYDAVVIGATPRELRELGFLSGYNGFSYLTPDLSDVGTTAGEYNEAESAAAMSQSLIVDNIVEEWGKHARGMSTVVFAVTVEHSKQLVARFKAAGIRAEHIDGTMPAAQRDAVLARVARGETEVFSNVGVVVEGLDIPRLKCCVLARPTKSLSRALQMMGRVRRPWRADGLPCTGEHAARNPSEVARIHDHAFVIKSHGLPDDDRDYSLTSKPTKPPSLTQCEQCLALYKGPRCPACDAENEPKPTGERVLQTVATAEQYEFSSSDTRPAPVAATDRPPVDIQWIRPREIDGVYQGFFEQARSWGPQRIHKLVGDKRVYHLPGTSRLDALLRPEIVGERIQVAYTGETQLQRGGVRKEFDVSIWEDEPEECTCAIVKRPPCGACESGRSAVALAARTEG